MPDPRPGKRGCTYVVPRDPRSPPTLADICAYLEAESLATYKWPERLEPIDVLLRTQIGKGQVDTARRHRRKARTLDHPAPVLRDGVTKGTGAASRRVL